MVCKKVCSECPFSNQSIKGWLADYSIEDLVQMVTTEQSFPCHKLMDHGMDSGEAQDLIQDGEMKLCRRFVESIIKSAKMPKYNQQLIQAMDQVKKEVAY